MNSKYTYSIIIPHKNSPSLLERCISSIPERDDTELIIVDDDSSPDIVDFESFPGKERKHTMIIFNKDGGGAGEARNIGVEAARGEKLLFADADDFFNYCLDEILSKYKEDDDDIIFFNATSVDSDSYLPMDRVDFLHRFIELYESNPQEGLNKLRYEHGAPWCKIIKKKLIEKHNIRFQKVQMYNDARFSYRVSYYAQTFKVDKKALYCVTYIATSITYTLTDEKILDLIRVSAERKKFYQDHIIDANIDHLFINYLIKAKDSENKNIYEKCLDIFEEYGFCQVNVECWIGKELSRRKKEQRILSFRKILLSTYKFFGKLCKFLIQ